MAKAPKIESVGIETLIPYARNSRTHSDAQVAQIAASIKEFGFTNPVLIDKDGGIIAGHGRVMAARKLKLDEVPCIRLGHLTDTQKRAYIIADNKLALNSGWDAETLQIELAELEVAGFKLDLTGFEGDDLTKAMFGDLAVDGEQDGEQNAAQEESAEQESPQEQKQAEQSAKLADRFMLPPFTVMNAREGWWQDRKRAWFALGIKSEEGRDAKAFGHAGATDEVSIKILAQQDGISIFDPVMCEIAYRWFSPVGGTVLDPFAGGSVRGIVASKLGRAYVGHELRSEQVDANRAQGAVICAGDATPPRWICGDSRTIDVTCADVQADMVFSCPPYADLEVYSDDPKDLSTMKYSEFKAVYFEIIRKACDRLKPDSFACFVVGEVRDKKGNYIDFVGDTVQAFRDAGLHYYNEAILVTSVGSLPIRAGKQFSASRKLGKTHQNILVFVKGDGKRAAARCGDVDVETGADLESVAGAEGGDA